MNRQIAILSLVIGIASSWQLMKQQSSHQSELCIKALAHESEKPAAIGSDIPDRHFQTMEEFHEQYPESAIFCPPRPKSETFANFSIAAFLIAGICYFVALVLRRISRIFEGSKNLN